MHNIALCFFIIATLRTKNRIGGTLKHVLALGAGYLDSSLFCFCLACRSTDPRCPYRGSACPVWLTGWLAGNRLHWRSWCFFGSLSKDACYSLFALFVFSFARICMHHIPLSLLGHQVEFRFEDIALALRGGCIAAWGSVGIDMYSLVDHLAG